MNVATQAPIRVLVTDDTALYRKLISDVLSKIPGVEVAGTSFDGEDCLGMIDQLKPDFVTLDINMPRRDGLSTLQEIRRRGIRTQVLMVSSPTAKSAEQTLQALRDGALDLILKPSGNDMHANRRSLEEQLLSQVDTIRSLLKRSRSSLSSSRTAPAPSKPLHRPKMRAFVPGTAECLCIGVSTGGPAALGKIICSLPNGLPIPIFIVQHMPPVFTKSLADHLAHSSRLQVTEAKHGEIALPGCVYIAPGGKQMKIAKKGTSLEILVTDDPSIGGCKPSVDYLLDSVGASCGGRTVVMILTGMGSDGLNGCKKLSALGAHIVAQSADTCVVYGMPRQIIENNLADEIVPLQTIAPRIVELLKAPARCLN